MEREVLVRAPLFLSGRIGIQSFFCIFTPICNFRDMIDTRIYKFNNSTVKIIYGDLLESRADVVVISGSVGLPMSGGLPGSVREIAGEAVVDDASKHPDAKLGDIVVTTAGNLPNKYLFQAVTVVRYEKVLGNLYSDDDPKVYEYIIGHSIAKSFRLLGAMDLTSIAFPCLGLGMANMPLDAVAKITAKTMSQCLNRTNKALTVELYLRDTYDVYSRFDYLPFFEWFAAYSHILKKEIERDQTEIDAPLHKFDEVEVADCTANSKHHVFISYSRKDSEKVRGICNLLNKQSIPYWIDYNGVYSGENFKEVIVNAISSAEIILFLSSVNSNSSSNVAKEIGLADKYDKVIIPVRLDATPMNPKIDYDLAGIDFVDLFTFDEKSVTKLKNAILGHLAMNNSSSK